MKFKINTKSHLMPKYKRVPVLSLLILVVILVIAGGINFLASSSVKFAPDISTPSPSASPPTITNPKSQPPKTNTPSTNTTQNQNNSWPSNPEEETLKISPNLPSFERGQNITGNLINYSTTKNYYSRSGRFSCTIYGLEMKEGTGWKNMNNCPTTSLPTTVTIGPGSTAFAVSFMGVGNTEMLSQAGTYRLNLVYSDTTDFSSTKTVYSAEFQIQ